MYPSFNPSNKSSSAQQQQIYQPLDLSRDISLDFRGNCFFGIDNRPALRINTSHAYIENIVLGFTTIKQLTHDAIVIEKSASLNGKNIRYSGYLLDKRMLPMRECIPSLLDLGQLTPKQHSIEFNFICPYKVITCHSGNISQVAIKHVKDCVYRSILQVDARHFEGELQDFVVFEFKYFRKKVPIIAFIDKNGRIPSSDKLESHHMANIDTMNLQDLPFYVNAPERIDLIQSFSKHVDTINETLGKSLQKRAARSLKPRPLRLPSELTTMPPKFTSTIRQVEKHSQESLDNPEQPQVVRADNPSVINIPIQQQKKRLSVSDSSHQHKKSDHHPLVNIALKWIKKISHILSR